ncbi:hypothetical protein MRY87_07730 [bacterium]|nr:hypothetical protein [bacterium]
MGWRLFFLAGLWVGGVSADEVCVYRNELGDERTVRSLRQVPFSLRGRARCFRVGPPGGSEQGVALAAPEEISLGKRLRKQRISSSVGPINLRWPRSAEVVLGKNPLRAMADAARMVSKALKQEGFPAKLRQLDLEWEVVFMDEDVPLAEVPLQLVSNCHPAWMTPPANIYVVVQRVAAGCGGAPAPQPSEVDAKMAEVLAHEMGHVVEAQILGGKVFMSERWRAEGFATYFERLASEYSSVIPTGSVSAEHYRLARESFSVSPGSFVFRGTAADYARASLYLEAVARERGIKGLLRVYDRLRSGGGALLDAIERETGWSRKDIEERARKVAE